MFNTRAHEQTAVLGTRATSARALVWSVPRGYGWGGVAGGGGGGEGSG